MSNSLAPARSELRTPRPGSLAVLGSTGTIGQQTLDVVRQYPELFKVCALSARSNVKALLEQCREFHPEVVAVANPEAASWLQQRLDGSVEVLSGDDSLSRISAHTTVHTVVAAVVGFAGCAAVLSAIRAGKHVALANKETLVSAGELVYRELQQSTSLIVPIDSEHSSVFQALRGESGLCSESVSRIVLTASGGPFYFTPELDLLTVTPEMALKHPTWNMGQKISIDSATLMNKGLEVIEASWLFRLPEGKIQVLVHPQSIIHGIVDFNDGTSLLVGANPDMRLPIAYSLSYLRSDSPQTTPGGRLPVGIPILDLAKSGELKFVTLDDKRFPAVRICRQALIRGGTAPAILNAANEELVAGFLDKKISFPRIVTGVEEVLSRATIRPITNFDDICQADQWAREVARSLIDSGEFR